MRGLVGTITAGPEDSGSVSAGVLGPTGIHEGQVSDMSDPSGISSGVTQSLNRRTVIKGAAWSVPVIMVASAAPALASSPLDIEITGVGTTCKHSGEGANNLYPKGYHIEFVFRNISDETITFTLPGLVSSTSGDMTSDPGNVNEPANPNTAGNPISDIVIPPNTAAMTWVVHYYDSESSNRTISFNYTYQGATLSGTLPGLFALSGDSCSSAIIGVPDDHPCSSASVPACSPTP